MNDDNNPKKIIATLVTIGFFILLILLIAFKAAAFSALYTEYSNTPVSELPSWVFWLLR